METNKLGNSNPHPDSLKKSKSVTRVINYDGKLAEVMEANVHPG